MKCLISFRVRERFLNLEHDRDDGKNTSLQKPSKGGLEKEDRVKEDADSFLKAVEKFKRKVFQRFKWEKGKMRWYSATTPWSRITGFNKTEFSAVKMTIGLVHAWRNQPYPNLKEKKST